MSFCCRFESNKQSMDEYSSKRGVDRVVVPRKGMSHVFRDTANTRDRNGQICSRLGCSSRANLPKVAQVRSSEKGKSLRPSLQSSSHSKEAIGSSSRTTSNPGKRLIEPRKTLSSQFETDSSETSSVQDEPQFSELIPPSEEIRRGPQAEGESTGPSNAILMDVGSTSAVSNTRSPRNLNQRPGLRGQEIKSTGPVRRAVSSRHGLRNHRCNSVSDVIPAGCSSSYSTPNRRKDTIKKGNCEGGSSSSTVRGKNMTGSSVEGRNSGSRNGISISDSRRSRNIPSLRNTSMASVRTQRSISGHARGSFSSQGNENPVATTESPVMVPLSPHSGDLNAPGVSFHTSTETPLSRSSSYGSYGRPGTSSEQLCSVMPVSPAEYDITHSLINQDSFRHYNMGGIAEVLLALERIEQDVELTHEQILLLETNLFLNGLNFYDHHRDMRLDIDNMSYEELLALEERMGTVSTALTEEALAECLKKSIYQSAPSDDADESGNEEKDDIKCCICQEEYIVGDEIGGLQCEHRFHVVCIQEWLQLKNWCPICKVSAAPSHSSSPH
ncbi:E3 ubiquitin-protein ligase HIP1 [Spatholobus suberectus]|nr:E3 ubiquitin-protein ligase HIP1 [Spatholobus suberectus]